MGKRSSLYLVLGLLLSVRPAFGHHSFSAEFDLNTPVRLDGTVTRIEWTNPHAFVFIDVKDADGKVTNWKVELASREELQVRNWTQQMPRVGGKINVRGWRARDGSSLANADSITTDAGIRLWAASSYHSDNKEPGALARHDSQERGLPSRNAAEPRAEGTTGELPRTSSPLPLIGLLGLLAIATGVGLTASRR